MVHINIQNASVTFAIYNAKTRSVRNGLFSAVGGTVREVDNTVYVKALDDITLNIKEGDRVGLIGHNGAGKSTLLKMLASVYEPLKGTIDIKGFVSSLTDITMGMDPENSGYENIIMRCIFMGMSFADAKNKVEEIIEFSELRDYIDLPMRTYSTGMYLRLAFTVATSIIPDILIMDEMISTGDATFIQKAEHRTRELIEKTKIIVISSHDLNMMQNICNRGIWMKQGKVHMDGPISEVIEHYNESIAKF